MGATSVTGVSGVGSAEGHTKGPNNSRNTYVPLVGPRVIAAGHGQLSTGTLVVYMPTPIPNGANLILSVTEILVSSAVTSDAATIGDVTLNVGGDLIQFTIKGTNNNYVNWLVVNPGFFIG
jgi:hypothetical protein